MKERLLVAIMTALAAIVSNLIGYATISRKLDLVLATQVLLIETQKDHGRRIGALEVDR